MKEQKLTPSELASKLAPVKIDENSKFGTSGSTSKSTQTPNLFGNGYSYGTDFDSWLD